jgi:hypothetical protein
MGPASWCGHKSTGPRVNVGLYSACKRLAVGESVTMMQTFEVLGLRGG